MGRAGWRRLLLAAAWVALFALAGSLAFQSVRTFDYWWHLRTGQLIAETGSIPRVDPFSFSAAGNRWVDVHWLHQLGLWGLYRLGGHDAVVVAKVALTWLLTALLATIGFRRRRPLVTVVALALALVVVCDRLMPRPELPTFVCLAGVLALLERSARRNDAWVYAVVGIQAFWVNVHGLFALGIAACATYLVAEILRPFVMPGTRMRVALVRRLACVTALATLVSLLNPNFLDGALYPIEQLGMIGPPEERGFFGSLITELIPPFGPQARISRLGVALFSALAALSFGAMLLNWRRIHGAHPLLWVAFLYLGLGAQRNIALFAIVAAPILVVNLNEFLDARRDAGGSRRRAGWELAAAGLTSVVLFAVATDAARGRFFPRLGALREPGLGVMEAFFPVGAADWIERFRPPGPICHHMADGGYLIWRLYPDYRVMSDGRLEVYGADRFRRLQMDRPATFRRADDEFHCGVALLHYSLVDSGDLLWWLYMSSSWRLAFVDEVAAVFVRVPEDEPFPYAEVDVDADDLFAPLDDARSATNQMRLLARTNFYTTLRRHERALAEWREMLARFPDIEQGPEVHAALLHYNGFTAAAEALYLSLLAERPHDVELRTQLGDLRLESGDREGAREAYDEALKIDPNHPYAMYRRALVSEAVGDLDGAALLYLRLVAGSQPGSQVGTAARLRLDALGR